MAQASPFCGDGMDVTGAIPPAQGAARTRHGEFGPRQHRDVKGVMGQGSQGGRE